MSNTALNRSGSSPSLRPFTIIYQGKNKAKGLSSLASRRGGTIKWNEPPLVVQKQVQRQSQNWRIYDYELRTCFAIGYEDRMAALCYPTFGQGLCG
ncbi:hypothetical protein DKX38_009066 [Salix brachista]|uniref:Uncharacterized protein n=1 Tax=Salix brachista TaxID=2182728 RepID=A0A5N5M9J5_9ROSI|nr:hypothetical protein DKX38_009066 [Salix brachista]